MGKRDAQAFPRAEEASDLFTEFLEDPEIEQHLDPNMEAPALFVGAMGIMLNDGKGRKAGKVITMAGGVINPSRKFGFPPKEARDAAAKEYTRSLRKQMIKAMDEFASGKELSSKEGGIVKTGQIAPDGKVKNMQEKKVKV